jgi:8-oxo-dGTP diphosphatase
MVDSTRLAVNVEAAVHRDGEYLLVERTEGEEHAAGHLALVGGTVEPDEAGEDVLAATARREVREVTGVEVGDVVYVTSATFEADTGTPCVNVVFLGRHEAGEGAVREPEAVAAVSWLAPEALGDAPRWTSASVAAAERRRAELDW